jgi:hypothetical protein
MNQSRKPFNTQCSETQLCATSTRSKRVIDSFPNELVLSREIPTQIASDWFEGPDHTLSLVLFSRFAAALCHIISSVSTVYDMPPRRRILGASHGTLL